MRLALFLMMLAGIPVLADAHPGKTDRYGGHRCLKECAEWKLYYQEYHLHDQEGRPVRVARPDRKAKKVRPADAHDTAQGVSEQQMSQAVPEQPMPEATQPAPAAAAAAIPPAAARDSRPLYAILLLLLLLLILRRRRARDQRGE